MSFVTHRRRFIAITAAAAGCHAFPIVQARADRPTPELHRWTGVALGAEARILLYHPNKNTAGRLFRACVAEISRLEAIFSLYRADSTLVRLNRDGALKAPPPELVELLRIGERVGEATGGAFDPTVQPLWQLYAEHFGNPEADPLGPSDLDIARTAELVDFRNVRIETDAIRFAKNGVALTLNGIAQGYITDKVAELLRNRGLENVLVDLGEMRALGRHPDGRFWRIGVTDPDRRSEILRTVDLSDEAMATSGGYGTPFDAAGNYHHIFDPRTGRSAGLHKSVTVIAPRATIADALSTAFTLLPHERIKAVLTRFGSTKAMVVGRDGGLSVYRAGI